MNVSLSSVKTDSKHPKRTTQSENPIPHKKKKKKFHLCNH